MIPKHIADAILVRSVEEHLFSLYETGELNGTIHACIGQELSGIAVCGNLSQGDFVFSNHRCHGHFLALTSDVKGLVAELMGYAEGVCGGVGGSQHLFVKDRFYSNGIQGGIVPVAAGRALAEKLKKTGNIGVVFIGDGTLGQGAVYETLNIASKWRVPLLVVVEDNRYAQSTPKADTLAGSIKDRFKAFDIAVFEGGLSDWDSLVEKSIAAIKQVRSSEGPVALILDAYRLCSHSKNDDCRSKDEIADYALRDPINVYASAYPDVYAQEKLKVDSYVEELIEKVRAGSRLSLSEYLGAGSTEDAAEWTEFNLDDTADRLVSRLNHAFHELMAADHKVVFIGEDVKSPYGGAFKVAAGLSDAYPDRVFSTPISELAITGIANGLALGGFRPVLEIMFGDFITLAFDQILNHSSKFHHMYNGGVNCPVVIRTPMGGHRGYGPTHSQTLDKFLAGIDGIKVVALNTFCPPAELYSNILKQETCPVIVLENKTDYGSKSSYLRSEMLRNHRLLRSNGLFPAYKVEPAYSSPDVCLIAYGGTVDAVLRATERLFFDHEILAAVLVLTQIHPINPGELSICAPRVYVVEEGSAAYGFGSEVIATLVESGQRFEKVGRIASLPVPIPSARLLESQVLLGFEQIVDRVVGDFHE